MNEPVTLDQTVRQVEGVAGRTMGDELFILDLVGRVLHRVTGVGIRIWELLEAGPSVAALIEQLESEFDVDRPRLEQDCLAFLTDLRERGLVDVEASDNRGGRS